MRGDKLLERKLAGYFGIEPRQPNKKKFDYVCEHDEPCAGCGVTPTGKARLISYIELKKLGLSDVMTQDERFVTNLCRSCFLLWREYKAQWAREYAKEHKVSYTQARTIRGQAWFDLIDTLSEQTKLVEQAKSEYGQKIVKYTIRFDEPMPHIPEGVMVTAITLLLKAERAIVVSTEMP